MTISLTEVVSRPVVDHTEPDSPRRLSLSLTPIIEVVASRDGPPAKRRRVDHNEASYRQTLKDCLQQFVLPHVRDALRPLSSREYNTQELAIQSVTAVAKTPDIRARIGETNGALGQQDEARIRKRASEVVEMLVRLPIYHIHPRSQRSSQEKSEAKPMISSTIRQAVHRAAIAQRSPIMRRKLRSHTDSYRSRPRAKQHEPQAHTCFQTPRRPYLRERDRELISKASANTIPFTASEMIERPTQPVVYHVDITDEEIRLIVDQAKLHLPATIPITIESLPQLCGTYPSLLNAIESIMPGREIDDIRNLCSDLRTGQRSQQSRSLSLSLARQAPRRKESSSHVSSLLLARELEGNVGFGRTRKLQNLQNELIQAHGDGLELVAEFTNCAGDISTMAWVSEQNVVCGTTAHSDSHNQQYNKPGNLLLCSTTPTKSTLRAFADHRVPRPLVEKGENSTEAMRQSQDPWLYSSVVSSDYDAFHDRAYTSSFDGTVKVWKVVDETMTALATWQHQGNVNFVTVAKDGSGRVAAAADVPSEAVRIYTVNPDDIAGSSYQSLSCSRTDANNSDKWAYFPATMQWGQAPGSQHILAIGYSPRSLTGDDHDIPEDKRMTGEVVLWDAAAGLRIPISNATTANVFEVAWHPTLRRFLVATSPCGLSIEPGVRTQIHLFQPDRTRPDEWFAEFQNLDCTASDINEISIKPNSLNHAYVTAACTDGKVYVWDTAQGDRPIHVLKHGQPVDEFNGDREREDTGVKFTVWGPTPDRLYTGSSDGMVKVWNVRNTYKPFVRDLLEAPGPISHGAFSPNYSKLAIGDATGRVFLLSLDKAEDDTNTTVPVAGHQVRRPRPYIPHPEPPPPPSHREPELGIGVHARRSYLDTHQLTLHPNPVIGAVQGPMYKATGLYRREAHVDFNPAEPLLAEYDRLQRQSVMRGRGSRRQSIRRLKTLSLAGLGTEAVHRANTELDLDVESIDEDDLNDLITAGAQLSIGDSYWDLDYEEMPIDL